MKWTIRRFKETVSTNADAVKLALDGADSGTVVVTDSQSGGEGRLGRKWFSPAGAGLYVSVLLRPVIKSEMLGYLSFCAANAAHYAVLKLTGICLSTKWPNDLMYNSRKVGGILSISRAGSNNIPEFSVIGLGLNIKKTLYPAELTETASCLEEAGASPEPEFLLEQYLSSLEYEIDDLQKNGTQFIRERLLRHMETIGRTVCVTENGRTTAGTAIDVDRSGALIIKDEFENRHMFYCGDVVNVRSVKNV